MATDKSKPFALRCDLLLKNKETEIETGFPSLGWQLKSGEFQSAYQIELYSDKTLMWNSGKVNSDESVCVFYGGKKLCSKTNYKWRVRVWIDSSGESGTWSEFQFFRTGQLTKTRNISSYPTVQSQVAPTIICKIDKKSFFYDFGKAAFGTVELTFSKKSFGEANVHLGEKLSGENRIDRTPPGTIRFLNIPVSVTSQKHSYRISITPDKRNTGPQAILMPESIGEVLPFRYCEIETIKGKIEPVSATRLEAHQPFDDDEANFTCDNEALNKVWELCKHTIKATTFSRFYIDGDRERIPYEADAYINQLCHYCTPC